MPRKDRSSSLTLLERALARGLRRGENFADELAALDGYTVTSAQDAEAICDALRKVVDRRHTAGNESALREVIRLFQRVETVDCPAFQVLASRGIPALVEFVDEALRDGQYGGAVFVALQILAIFGERQGTDIILRAARKPFEPDDYMWALILGVYGSNHPERQRLFRKLSDPVPPGFLGVALLDNANAALSQGAAGRQPFDSPSGEQQLESWITDSDPEHFSYAASASRAIAFLPNAGSDRLLALALDHPSADVQIEAAFAAGRAGRMSATKWLARMCLNLHQSGRAKHYLRELGCEHMIPAESEDEEFRAKAEFAEWLAHPAELGRPPDSVEVLDHRVLAWPPDRERRPFWLIKYRVGDAPVASSLDVGVGLVGSVTFCFFTYELDRRPTEDGYAIHCYWEMQHRGLIAETDVRKDAKRGKRLLAQCPIDGVGRAQVLTVAKLLPELEYPRRSVTLAKGTYGGKAGWLIVDGPRSHWYPADEFPPENSDKTVLMIHIGRILLGFPINADRKQFL